MCNDLERSAISSNLDDQQQHDDRNEDRELTHCCLCRGVLRHPSVLWGCLHSCCRQCSESKFAAAAEAAGPVVCPVCDTVVEATDVVDNPIVAARVEGHQRVGQAAATTCDSCRDDEVDSLARHWCTICCRSLCDGCRSWHDRFSKDHPMVAVGSDADRTLSSSQQQQQSSSSASAALPGPAAGGGLCAVHRIPLEFFCFDCARAKCLACVKECMEARHDSSGLTSERVGKHVTSLGESLRAELALIDERLDAVTGLQERAVAARSVEVAKDERLDASHRLASDAVATVFEAALKDLNEAYDSLAEDSAAPDLAARARPLAERLTHAFKYGSALLEAGGSAVAGGAIAGAIDCMLDQRQIVLACLDSLANEASKLPKVADESVFSLVECKQDDRRLRHVAFRFMGGIAGAVTDGFTKEGVEQTGSSGSGDGDRRSAASFLGSTGAGDSVAVEPPSMGSRSLSTSAGTSSSSSSWLATGTDARPDEEPRNMPSATDARKSTVTASSAGPLAVLDVKEIVDSFRAVSTCHDVAITADGHVLLAALENGLKQYEASSGRKRRTWYPSHSGRMRVVSTVDSLADGRAAVGLIGARCVVVLSREPPDGWQEERFIDIATAPYRIAVLGDRFAVASATARETGKSFGWTPGPHFSTGTVAPTSKLSMSRKLGYDILGIALVAVDVSAAAGDSTAAVVVSSHDKILTQSGMHRFVVEAYGDGGGGACLWQYTSSEDIFDLCTLHGASRVVYLALPKSRRMVALSGDDGSSLADVLTTSTHTLIPPNRLAASLEHRILAVLSGNGLVTLYPIA